MRHFFFYIQSSKNEENFSLFMIELFLKNDSHFKTIWMSKISHLLCISLKSIVVSGDSKPQCTEVGFTSFQSGGFTMATVVNQLDKILVNPISVQWVEILYELTFSYLCPGYFKKYVFNFHTMVVQILNNFVKTTLF